jgi:hypothetical protein
MADELTRLRLEMAIDDKSGAIDIMKPDAAWIDDPEWNAFIDSWFKLIDYYESQTDTVIGPLAMKSFADFIRLLRKALLSGELDESRYELVKEELTTLEYVMDEIVTQTMMNLRSHHPELNI